MPNGARRFAKPENRLKFCGEAEKFLTKYLSGRYEEARERPGRVTSQEFAVKEQNERLFLPESRFSF